MAIITELKENWKVDKQHLNSAISTLKKNMTDFKVERKSEWKIFKKNFNDDIISIEKSLKDLTTRHKK